MSKITKYKQYINGEWVNSTSDKVIEVINPVTEEVLATVPAGTKEDVYKALVAAKKAQDPVIKYSYLLQLTVWIPLNCKKKQKPIILQKYRKAIEFFRFGCNGIYSSKI